MSLYDIPMYNFAVCPDTGIKYMINSKTGESSQVYDKPKRIPKYMKLLKGGKS